MTIKAIQPSNNIMFKGKTKKTERGNEYPSTNLARNVGAATGALATGLIGKRLSKKLDTPEGMDQLKLSLKNINKSMAFFGETVDEQAVAIKKGSKLLVRSMVVVGLVVGGLIGSVIDKKKNKASAIAADKIATKVQ